MTRLAGPRPIDWSNQRCSLLPQFAFGSGFQITGLSWWSLTLNVTRTQTRATMSADLSSLHLVVASTSPPSTGQVIKQVLGKVTNPLGLPGSLRRRTSLDSPVFVRDGVCVGWSGAVSLNPRAPSPAFMELPKPKDSSLSTFNGIILCKVQSQLLGSSDVGACALER